jgi:hypothetical protein
MICGGFASLKHIRKVVEDTPCKEFARPAGPRVNSHDRKVVEHNADKEFVRPAGPSFNSHDCQVVVGS